MDGQSKEVPQRRAHRWAGTSLGVMMVLGLLVGALFGNAPLGASFGVVVGALLEMASWRSRSHG